jgi:hypothetical protein
MIDRYEYLTVAVLLMRKCGDSGGMIYNILIKSQMYCTGLRPSTAVVQKMEEYIYIKHRM